MSDWAKWLEISGYGLDLLGLAIGAWYTVSKWGDRVRSDNDKLLAGSLDQPSKRPEQASPPGTDLNTLEHSLRRKQQDSHFRMDVNTFPDIPPIKDEPVGETGAEDLLAARKVPLLDPFITNILDWGWRVAGKLKLLGWLRFVLLALPALVFFAFVLLLVALLLPLMILGYIFDIDKDYRLRIIVLAFMVGFILQTIKVMIH